MRRLGAAALLTGMLAAAACGLSSAGTGPAEGALPGSDSGGSESSAADRTAPDGASDGGADDAIADAGTDALGCPDVVPKPVMVNVGAFCIDATEVSITLFAEFAQSDAAVAPPPVAGCEWKTAYTYADAGWSPSGLPAMVDWCDAWAYCHAMGKRLCGGIGGVPLPGPAETDDPTKSQWNFACSHGDKAQKYPYGPAYDASVCGGPLHEAITGGACQGGFPGVFDMSGNVAEWIDSCAGTDRAADCQVRGGSYLSTKPDQLACSGGPPAKRDTIPPATGFRCCAP